MDNAAENNHLETLQWLRRNRTEGWTLRAATAAARNGHLCGLAYLLLGKKHETIDGYIDGGEFGIRRNDTNSATQLGAGDAAAAVVVEQEEEVNEEGNGNGHQDVHGLQLAPGLCDVVCTVVETRLKEIKPEILIIF